MSRRNKCEKCAAFYDETKKKMLAVFPPDDKGHKGEILMVVTQLCAMMKAMNISLAKAAEKKDLKQQFAVRRGLDMAGITVGKFLVALNHDERSRFNGFIKKEMGMILNVRDEACPHETGGEDGKEEARSDDPSGQAPEPGEQRDAAPGASGGSEEPVRDLRNEDQGSGSICPA